MGQGRKTGGRTSGTPNRKTQAVIDRLVALGCFPIEGMASDVGLAILQMIEEQTGGNNANA
jgi:hypothetical protein